MEGSTDVSNIVVCTISITLSSMIILYVWFQFFKSFLESKIENMIEKNEEKSWCIKDIKNDIKKIKDKLDIRY